MADSKITTAIRFSPQSESEKQIAPRFAVCELLDVDEFDDAAWQDFLSQYADTGVGQ